MSAIEYNPAAPLTNEELHLLSEPELNRVYSIMRRYNRTSGYIAFVGDVIEFFDSAPVSFDGAYVSIDDIKMSIDDYQNSAIC